MLIRISSARCIGIDALPVTVEVNISGGIGIHLVGLADAAVKESLLRTVTALQSLGFKVPGKKIVINLAPADMHKQGSGYDLPIAIGIIAASEQLGMPDADKYVISGELGLDGTVRPVRGALSIVEMAGGSGKLGCILPLESAREAAQWHNCRVFGVSTLKEALEIVCRSAGYGRLELDGGASQPQWNPGPQSCAAEMDFSEIMGQESAKRGLEIAAAGGHNVIMVGAPGSGKSSLAKAMCGILPPLSIEESVQASKVYSAAGKGDLSQGLLKTRPFRAPHCSASAAALLGGGADNIVPGEISLAHNGVLFLDEFCEIPRKSIEVLRAPMEDKKIVISRLRMKVAFPADFMLIAATNPCPCGYWGEGDRCTCTPAQRAGYLSKLSGPIMDRIDIHLWLHPVKTSQLVRRQPAESSAAVAERVAKARLVQRRRFAAEDGLFCNAGMSSRQMEKYCPLDTACRDFLEKVVDRAGLSARAYGRIIKLARTIADLEGAAQIKVEHIAEAASYRFLDKQQP